MTNYDRLILSISTDGSITPEEALNQASSILFNHFIYISDFGKTKTTIPENEISKSTPKVTDEKKKDTDKKKDPTEKPKKKRGRPKKE